MHIECAKERHMEVSNNHLNSIRKQGRGAVNHHVSTRELPLEPKSDGNEETGWQQESQNRWECGMGI